MCAESEKPVESKRPTRVTQRRTVSPKKPTEHPEHIHVPQPSMDEMGFTDAQRDYYEFS